MENKNINILIVEDEIFASIYISSILKSLGFSNIDVSRNANDAINVIFSKHIELVFMDINIEGDIDGIGCAKILNQKYFIPIIFTTAYGDSKTIDEANQSNIYGYLVKPFESHDLEAVLKIALKMIGLQQNNQEKPLNEHLVSLGKEQTYDLLNETFFLNNNPIHLTKKELSVLNLFCNNINQNISYDTLCSKVWDDKEISNSTIRDTIARLKKKLPKLNIDNIAGFGYILKIQE